MYYSNIHLKFRGRTAPRRVFTEQPLIIHARSRPGEKGHRGTKSLYNRGLGESHRAWISMVLEA